MVTTGTTDIEFDVRVSDAPLTARERERVLAAPGFGEVFTDHMITIRWTGAGGWHDARLEPYGPFTLDPATSVFHYAQEIFEGLKAYRTRGGEIVAFRPQANAARFNRSAARMAMPELPPGLFLRSLEVLVGQDRDWVPTAPEHSLYLRPFMIATQRGLGVNRPSGSYIFAVIASPAASYFRDGVQPVTVWLSGCDQVVWLDAAQHSWVEEMGGMNLFFVYGSGPQARLVTPALTGTLLPGITRDTLLKLGPDLGVPAEEGAVSVAQWRADSESGELTEVFACGTAAVITPVGRVKGPAGEWAIGDGAPGPVTQRLREELLGIQYGHRPDPYGWVHKIC